MELCRVLRERRSTRHFAIRAVPVALVQQLVQQARWAPSSGNTQPWKVCAIPSEGAQAFARTYESPAWEHIYPVLRLVMARRPVLEGRIKGSALTTAALRAVEREIFLLGTPSIVVIYHLKPSAAERWHLVCSAFATALHRLVALRGLAEKVAYLGGLLLRWPAAMRVTRDTVTGSLACFMYALTLAAQDRGLASCIQYTYAVLGTKLSRELHLGRRAEIVGCVAIGYPDDEQSQNPNAVGAGTRNDVAVLWQTPPNAGPKHSSEGRTQ